MALALDADGDVEFGASHLAREGTGFHEGFGGVGDEVHHRLANGHDFRHDGGLLADHLADLGNLRGDAVGRNREFEEDRDRGVKLREHGLPVDHAILKHGGGQLLARGGAVHVLQMEHGDGGQQLGEGLAGVLAAPEPVAQVEGVADVAAEFLDVAQGGDRAVKRAVFGGLVVFDGQGHAVRGGGRVDVVDHGLGHVFDVTLVELHVRDAHAAGLVQEAGETGVHRAVDGERFGYGVEQVEPVGLGGGRDQVEFGVRGDVFAADFGQSDAVARDNRQQVGLRGAVGEFGHVDEGVDADGGHGESLREV